MTHRYKYTRPPNHPPCPPSLPFLHLNAASRRRQSAANQRTGDNRTRVEIATAATFPAMKSAIGTVRVETVKWCAAFVLMRL